MPVPIPCHVCHEGRYAPRGSGSYACRPSRGRSSRAT
ncbi:hypothetical protein SPILM97S_00015 [Streptomyces pilosus]